MTDESTATTFGQLLKRAREAAGLSLREVEAETGISKSLLGNMEQDNVASPNPHVLNSLASTLDVELIDLYTAAGYVPAQGLPTFSPYLRSKYSQLPPEAQSELAASFTRIAERYGMSEAGPNPGEDE
ncbi:MAG: helix-turn-helix transcriptional regulator [Nocardioidaceae bacterium]|nr:helix-turn-helix transcriptional regulator [Nocardioidaceae bacterium]